LANQENRLGQHGQEAGILIDNVSKTFRLGRGTIDALAGVNLSVRKEPSWP